VERESDLGLDEDMSSATLGSVGRGVGGERSCSGRPRCQSPSMISCNVPGGGDGDMG
jgi:hypothetical protein